MGTTQHGLNLTTDQKVGGSSPSERASWAGKAAGQHPFPVQSAIRLPLLTGPELVTERLFTAGSGVMGQRLCGVPYRAFRRVIGNCSLVQVPSNQEQAALGGVVSPLP
jgi:hypothetical protein